MTASRFGRVGSSSHRAPRIGERSFAEARAVRAVRSCGTQSAVPFLVKIKLLQINLLLLENFR